MARSPTTPLVIGRYTLYDAIASGGMATVYLGRLLASEGVARTVGIKRLHPHFAEDPDFVTMFLDEARLASRIHHPNVVAVLDFLNEDGELFLVMEYIEGESLSRLLREARKPVALPIALGILCGALRGLSAAHGAKNERGEALHIVHRDVSPQNILVGVDGVARVLDFGVAKAVGRLQTTREGQIKGKIAYMAPEQLTGGAVDARTDVYAAGVVLWETLTGQRLFAGDNEGFVLARVLAGASGPPSHFVAGLPPEIDEVVMRAVEVRPGDRFASARDMAAALEAIGPGAELHTIGEWVSEVAKDFLSKRSEAVRRMETEPHVPSAGRARLIPPASPATELETLAEHGSVAVPAVPREGSSRGRSAVIYAVATIGVGAVALALTNARPAASAAHAIAGERLPASAAALAQAIDASPPEVQVAASGSTAPATPRSRPPLPRLPPTPKVNCNPSYIIDEQGNHHRKPECY